MAEVHPYRSTPVFDQDTLPATLRARHTTKAGVWGVIRVIEGQLQLNRLDPPSVLLLDALTPSHASTPSTSTTSCSGIFQ